MELTPAMQQYVKVKRQYPEALLLFRMGDFYETFFDDAKEMAHILNITLTKRGTNPPVPLAGIPFHALDNYLPKLIKAGKTVVIVEQTEDPKLAKGRVVKRDVVRVVTPGTLIEDNFLDSRSNNYILSMFIKNKVGMAFSDVSTGEFYVTECNLEEIFDIITKIMPSEILVPETFDQNLSERIKKLTNAKITFQPIIYFNRDFAEEEIKDFFNVLSLRSFELENKEETTIAAGALLYYFKYTHKTKLPHIQSIQWFDSHDYMILDAHTIKNLELIKNLEGGEKNTLLWVLDFTQTPMGARTLRKNILHPLKEKNKILERLNKVEKIMEGHAENIEHLLKGFPDLERLASKIAYGTATPRDLISIKNAINKSNQILAYAKNIHELNFQMDQKLNEISQLIEASIIEDAPIMYKDGGFIKKGFNKELDELNKLKNDSKTILMEMEERERKKTGIKNLKIGYNKVFGYFFEIPKTQVALVPKDYIRKQTLVNYERFINEELKRLEEKIISAEEKAKALELEIFSALLDEIKKYVQALYNLAHTIGFLDFLNSLALAAKTHHYTKPKINEEGLIEIKGGRHPVIELIEQEKFVKNDLYMHPTETNLIILTGPNMAGKSTYLRQNALIILMAHIGSFVPADFANIPLTDRIFTRIGAHDNLALGLSTFMVEMIETANILNNATKNSFIILDEIGRGTSTYDGLAIAWAVVEYIHKKIGAKTLFATHYHQICELGNKYSGIKNFHITAQEINNNIIFLRKVVPGSVDKSYGIAVAKLAGLPQEVIDMALQIEQALEKNKLEKKSINDVKKTDLIKQKTLLGFVNNQK